MAQPFDSLSLSMEQMKKQSLGCFLHCSNPRCLNFCKQNDIVVQIWRLSPSDGEDRKHKLGCVRGVSDSSLHKYVATHKTNVICGV